MVLRPLNTSGHPHGRFGVDQTVTFEAGMVGQLLDVAGNTVVTLAGTKPIGLIDDNKTATFTQPVIGEVHTVASAAGATFMLNNANVVPGSELVYVLDATGVATACTESVDYTATSYANALFTVLVAPGAIDAQAPYLDLNGDTVNESVYVSVNYHFAVPGVAGADTTLASGLCTLHFQKGEFAVSIYDTATAYAVNDQLYVGDGAATHAPLGVLCLTARTGSSQIVGVVVQPPTASNPLLTLITDFDFGTWK